MGRRRSHWMTTGVVWVALVAAALVGRPGIRAAPVDPTPAVPAGQLYTDDPVGALAAGRLLVAARKVGDPAFAQSIVLILEYANDGAAGLIVNRPTRVPVQRVLPDLPAPRNPAPHVFLGGPVSMGEARALLRAARSPVDAPQVLPGIHLLATPELLERAMAAGITAGQLRLFVGYAGWGPGQLEREVRRGDWFVFDGEADVVFDPAPGTLWDRRIALTDVIEL